MKKDSSSRPNVASDMDRTEARRAFMKRAGAAGATAAGAALVLATDSKPAIAMGSGGSKSKRRKAQAAYS
jgi:hypothetical protein